MKLFVEQCDIDGARRGAQLCPIAGALNRKVGIDAEVGMATASVKVDDLTRIYALDDAGIDWRRNFDRGDVMHPVILELTDTGVTF